MAPLAGFSPACDTRLEIKDLKPHHPDMSRMPDSKPRRPKSSPKNARQKQKPKAKPTRKTALKASAPVRRRAAKPDAVDRLIEAGATALALPLDPAWRDNVALNVRLILSHAARVEEFALPDDAEPAPVFHA